MWKLLRSSRLMPSIGDCSLARCTGSKVSSDVMCTLPSSDAESTECEGACSARHETVRVCMPTVRRMDNSSPRCRHTCTRNEAMQTAQRWQLNVPYLQYKSVLPSATAATATLAVYPH
jgi:hypothetical protein